MRIKRLEICGFKSFVDRTILTFPDPITGIERSFSSTFALDA